MASGITCVYVQDSILSTTLVQESNSMHSIIFKSTCSLESSALLVQWYLKLDRVVLFTRQNVASECNVTLEWYRMYVCT